MFDSAPADAVCIGMGVGVAGVVGADDGSVRFAPNLGWEDVPLGRLLGERLEHRVPVTVGNDGDAGALAEHSRGAARGHSHVIYVSGEVGVGGGVIIDGRPLRGFGGYAGEIGHMTVNARGRLCHCGRRGCWETEIGQLAVLAATGAPADAALSDVLAAYAAGDRKTVAALRRVGRWVGVGIVNLVNVFNPEVVVFGGQTRGVFAATEPVVLEVLALALAAPRAQVTLKVAALGPDSTLIGAAELAFDAFLTDPLRGVPVRSAANA
jgi:predicted NBD/HSP70 family sugar kinase